MQKEDLLAACESGNVQVVKQLCLSRAQLGNRDATTGTTALHVASKSDRGEVIKILCDYKAEVNVRDAFGRTPLHVAAAAGAQQALIQLLASGADRTMTDGQGRLALRIATDEGQSGACLVLSSTAVSSGKGGGGGVGGGGGLTVDEGKGGIGIALASDPTTREIYVLALIAGGPAARTGMIAEGDALVKIDNKEVKGMTLSDVRAAVLDIAGTPCELQVKRGGTIHNVRVIRESRLYSPVPAGRETTISKQEAMLMSEASPSSSRARESPALMSAAQTAALEAKDPPKLGISVAAPVTFDAVAPFAADTPTTQEQTRDFVHPTASTPAQQQQQQQQASSLGYVEDDEMRKRRLMVEEEDKQRRLLQQQKREEEEERQRLEELMQQAEEDARLAREKEQAEREEKERQLEKQRREEEEERARQQKLEEERKRKEEQEQEEQRAREKLEQQARALQLQQMAAEQELQMRRQELEQKKAQEQLEQQRIQEQQRLMQQQLQELQAQVALQQAKMEQQEQQLKQGLALSSPRQVEVESGSQQQQSQQQQSQQREMMDSPSDEMVSRKPPTANFSGGNSSSNNGAPPAAAAADTVNFRSSSPTSSVVVSSGGKPDLADMQLSSLLSSQLIDLRAEVGRLQSRLEEAENEKRAAWRVIEGQRKEIGALKEHCDTMAASWAAPVLSGDANRSPRGGYTEQLERQLWSVQQVLRQTLAGTRQDEVTNEAPPPSSPQKELERITRENQELKEALQRAQQQEKLDEVNSRTPNAMLARAESAVMENLHLRRHCDALMTDLQRERALRLGTSSPGGGSPSSPSFVSKYGSMSSRDSAGVMFREGSPPVSSMRLQGVETTNSNSSIIGQNRLLYGSSPTSATSSSAGGGGGGAARTSTSPSLVARITSHSSNGDAGHYTTSLSSQALLNSSRNSAEKEREVARLQKQTALLQEKVEMLEHSRRGLASTSPARSRPTSNYSSPMPYSPMTNYHRLSSSPTPALGGSSSSSSAAFYKVSPPPTANGSAGHDLCFM